MITASYTRDQLYSEFAAQTLQQGTEDMVTVMRKQISTYYKGNIIAQQLNSGIIHIRRTPSSANASIDIPLQQRFLDIKKLRSGKRKVAYAPVYNKYLWGYVYKYIIPTLRYGLTLAVRTDIVQKIQNSYASWDSQKTL